jgi:hypothetical protein
MIVTITGGRDVQPTARELEALQLTLYKWKCGALRIGCCPTGVDAAAFAFMTAKPICSGTGPVSTWRWWAVERWVADWHNETGRMVGEPKEHRGRRYWPSAGPARTEAMLDGDRSRVLRVDARGIVSVGGSERLVAWPGGPGTDGAKRAAVKRLLDVVSIADLRAP